MINQSLNDLRLNRESSSWWGVETEGYIRHKAGRTCIPPIARVTSKHFLETLWVQFGHHALKVAAQIPEAVRRLVDFGPHVGLVVVLVQGVLAAGAEHVLLHHHLRGSHKQVQAPLQQHGLDVGAGGLVEGQVPSAAPRAPLDVVHLHGEGALVVPADAGDVVDAVLVEGCQALTARHAHRGQVTPVVLAGIEAEEVFTCREKRMDSTSWQYY